jgi:hypothetical protein
VRIYASDELGKQFRTTIDLLFPDKMDDESRARYKMNIESTDTIHKQLIDKLMTRDPRMDVGHASELTVPLIAKARDWRDRLSWLQIGVRPIYSDSRAVAAHLCDHTVDGCDCGVHIE